MMTSDDEARVVAHLAERMSAQFPRVQANTVLAAVNASYAEFAGKPVRDFVPILVERAAGDRLRNRSVGH